MALLDIIVAPDPRLKKKSLALDSVDKAAAKLMKDMLETMYEAPGVGLAAPQVGVLKRIIVVDPARENEKPQPIKMANPEILWSSDEIKEYEEGCLSLPKAYDLVQRPDRIKVQYIDENNQIQLIEADGILAVVIQHEIDHLDGVLFVDHISTLKRGIILRRLTKLKKLGRNKKKTNAAKRRALDFTES
ncbi:MAG TPA: peptide deformylase [Rhodospirillaceae bacterium]|nr:peptide deformylase [Rhodospirillaceae bacterium]